MFSIGIQKAFGAHYAIRNGYFQKDFFAEANPDAPATELRKLKCPYENCN